MMILLISQSSIFISLIQQSIIMNHKSKKVNHKRLTIPIDPEVQSLVNEIASYTRMSMSQILLGIQKETIEHLKLKKLMAEHFNKQGAKLVLESVMENGRPDLIAQFDERTVFIECLIEPTQSLCIRKVLKYSRYTDDICFAIPSDKFDNSLFIGLGVAVFLCDLKKNIIEKKIEYPFDSEIFNERKSKNNKETLVFRTTSRILKDVDNFIKTEGFRNRTEVINYALRRLLYPEIYTFPDKNIFFDRKVRKR